MPTLIPVLSRANTIAILAVSLSLNSIFVPWWWRLDFPFAIFAVRPLATANVAGEISSALTVGAVVSGGVGVEVGAGDGVGAGAVVNVTSVPTLGPSELVATSWK